MVDRAASNIQTYRQGWEKETMGGRYIHCEALKKPLNWEDLGILYKYYTNLKLISRQKCQREWILSSYNRNSNLKKN